MTFTKIDPADLDSPRRELSNGGLKSVIALLVRRQIIFSPARIGRPTRLFAKRGICTLRMKAHEVFQK